MSTVSAFKFPHVSKRLPPYVIENLVDLWCVRQGAIRYVSSNGRMWHVYVDVKEWLPGGFEMRDKLNALKAMGKYEKKDIPVHPLKFGRYLLVCPSYTLAEHEAYMATLTSPAETYMAEYMAEQAAYIATYSAHMQAAYMQAAYMAPQAAYMAPQAAVVEDDLEPAAIPSPTSVGANWDEPHPIPPGWDDAPRAPANGWDAELLD
jgi:hypothetical protein